MAKAKTTKKASSAKPKGKKEVKVDRRTSPKGRRKSTTDRRQKSEDVEEERREIPLRRKVARRRQIDPTTCEREYNKDEIEFMHALDAYKRSAGRMFPTCSEILEVLHGLGYRHLTPEELVKLGREKVEAGSADTNPVDANPVDASGEDAELLETSLEDFEG